jgi:tetratricopeptide (TPR) repeat protein
MLVERAALLAIFCLGIASAESLRDALSEAVARNNEAVGLVGEGRDAEAEGLYRAALDARFDDDLTRAKIANNLAALYERHDRYRDAERLFYSALQWRQKALPATSVEVAYSLNNLGEVYRAEGRDWEARNLMETALRTVRQSHQDAAGLPIMLSNLAIVLCRFGELDQAEGLLREALVTFDRLQKSGGREYAVTLGNLGQILEAKDDLETAVPLYEQAIAIFELSGPPARKDLAATLANLGELYQRIGRMEDARQAEQRALQLLSPEGDGALRAQILRHLGNIVAKAGSPADSLPYFEQSLLIQEKTLGAEHPTTASLLLDYSSATLRAGNKSLSRKLRKRATDLLARINSRLPDQMTVSLRDLHDTK